MLNSLVCVSSQEYVLLLRLICTQRGSANEDQLHLVLKVAQCIKDKGQQTKFPTPPPSKSHHAPKKHLTAMRRISGP